MHLIQQKILDLSDSQDLGILTLRQIGELVGESHPQKIKHHLLQLSEKGLIKYIPEKKIIQKIEKAALNKDTFIKIPILGSADCGPATVYAEERVEGLLNVSNKIIKPKKGLYAIRAVGQSMNRANINGQSLENGDYAIIDSNYKSPKNKDYVLSVIDGVCNIKMFFQEPNGQVVLLSQSTKNYPPIYIDPSDKEYIICGKVIQVLKTPKV